MTFIPKTTKTYYSIGSLQSLDGIEKWTWTNDKYDLVRLNIGIVFGTYDEASL